MQLNHLQGQKYQIYSRTSPQRTMFCHQVRIPQFKARFNVSLSSNVQFGSISAVPSSTLHLNPTRMRYSTADKIRHGDELELLIPSMEPPGSAEHGIAEITLNPTISVNTEKVALPIPNLYDEFTNESPPPSSSGSSNSSFSSDGDFAPEMIEEVDESLEFEAVQVKEQILTESSKNLPVHEEEFDEPDSIQFEDNYVSDAELPAPKRRKIRDDFPFVQMFEEHPAARIGDGEWINCIDDQEKSIDYEENIDQNPKQNIFETPLRKIVLVPFDSSMQVRRDNDLRRNKNLSTISQSDLPQCFILFQTEWNLACSQPLTRLTESALVTDPRGGVLCLYLKGALPLEHLKRQISAAEHLRLHHSRVWKQCSTGAHRDKGIITMGTSRSYQREFYALKATKHEKVADFISASHETLIRVDDLLKEHFPAVHQLYSALNRQRELPTVYATLQLNNGASNMHRDRGDCRHGVCAVWPLGNDFANAQKSWQGGDLLLQDIKVQVDMHPGDVIFFPGHSITHGNLPVTSGVRMSCAAYLNQDFLSLAPIDTSDVPLNPKALKSLAEREIRRTVKNSTASISVQVDAPVSATPASGSELVFINTFMNPNGKM
jgi:hypothetical protein